jgi:beta-glucanase (GH16 family)
MVDYLKIDCGRIEFCSLFHYLSSMVGINMKRRNPLAVAISLLVASGAWAADSAAQPQAKADAAQPQYEGYKLVWADEFDKDGQPDPANWTYERGFVRNQELQWYQPENARVEKGFLVIEAKREQKKNPNYMPGVGNWQRSREYAEYTSSCLTTNKLHAWTYGRFEMRGRIDTRAGLWPAWWALGTARSWPANGEIDMMEYYRGDLLANACWAGPQGASPAWSTSKKPITKFDDPDWSKKFHVWRMDWDQQALQLYVDGELLNTVDLSKTINPGPEKINPFTEPHYILLNLAIGGTAGGDPSKTEFPARFEVDYVRVYQKVASATATVDPVQPSKP